ncbi:2,4-dienoyl-CoA reductase-like NADH-dependent reductase (Old Yellow Enzyme family) [Amycolatopsis lexingtonensis]|uniref:2,4-dienoyl-CoA reductase-like NADH-dependent reductase (Old Yellow Enzyme family) n=2 Tax=Amycolatopsis lexingtonensis TaxID=218822 RepID=A0ABR9HSC0_9PSEU|nr:12-oxophytodienoate reductase [Amycolatopsis lexingtonensis]MBE1493819.1 2,4-dienoyl-CoA reductase-like NADH-dependent reductase (Old Yellow Enzyme family) [Amycolatopsis lexingtonensis]
MENRAVRTLSRPITLGGVTLPNRVAMAPMTRGYAPGGVPGADVAAYYARRAAGGTGLVITEGSYVDHPSAGQHDLVPHLYGAEALAGWARVTAAVHDAGGRIFAQLQHVGMARLAGDPPHPGAPAIGPSGRPLEGTVPGRTMTTADIDDVVGAFGEAAKAAEDAGFDGVELHGAHGYLIDQFLWAGTNHRTDGYGGSVRARTRFAAEAVAAVRARVTPGFPVVIRLSQWKASDYDAHIVATPEDFGVVLGALADAGADAFHISTRRFWLPAFDGADLTLAGWAKKLSGKPVIAVGSVGLDTEFTAALAGGGAGRTGIDGLLDRLEADEFDVVAVGRSLLADPEWTAKILDGRDDEVVPFTPEALGVLH